MGIGTTDDRACAGQSVVHDHAAPMGRRGSTTPNSCRVALGHPRIIKFECMVTEWESK